MAGGPTGYKMPQMWKSSASVDFEITSEAFSKANKRGTLIHLGAQPVDHPYPLAMSELRYLKFALFRVEG